MARQANLTDRDDDDAEGQGRSRIARQRQERVEEDSSSPSPTISFSSDKENRTATAGSIAQSSKARSMGPPQTPQTEQGSAFPNRKRKLADREPAPNATQRAHQHKLDEVGDRDLYDPEQSMEERRAVRKDYRGLSRELTDSRAEFLAPGSNGLINTLYKSNELFSNVRQTSDATLDSRLLVSTASLSAKRTQQLTLGDNVTGIDVDDFVGRCITFMRHGPSGGESSFARRRRARDDSDEEANVGEDYDEGDAFDWEFLGRQACFPNNVRPPVPGFLLGPLSVQKRARRVTQRRQQLRRDPQNVVRPDELKAKDLEQAENSNLTTLCSRILMILQTTQNEALERVNARLSVTTMSDEEHLALMEEHGLADDDGLPFFKFVVNPKSFGQTVENIFYVSFLIRDGRAGILSDHNLMPTLHPIDPEAEKNRKDGMRIEDRVNQKNQAVFHLDFETWEDIIETFHITESVIPHRQADPGAQVSATGWYA